ncbi:unnamed protein product [Amoebophrya sp. A25]|nr:unnamed protein product [Amoebophrya sp. A25]|eukprot:GSA25T00013634001.1
MASLSSLFSRSEEGFSVKVLTGVGCALFAAAAVLIAHWEDAATREEEPQRRRKPVDFRQFTDATFVAPQSENAFSENPKSEAHQEGTMKDNAFESSLLLPWQGEDQEFPDSQGFDPAAVQDTMFLGGCLCPHVGQSSGGGSIEMNAGSGNLASAARASLVKEGGACDGTPSTRASLLHNGGTPGSPRTSHGPEGRPESDCSTKLRRAGPIYRQVFTPTQDYQVVPEGAVVPAGLDIRMNFEAGTTEARLPGGG